MFRRWIFLAAVLSVFVYAPSFAEERQDSLAPLKAWVGKYPEDKIDGKDAWSNKLFKERVQTVMGADRWGRFWDEFYTDFYVKQKGDLLLMQFCKPHECPETVVQIYVNLKKDDVNVCWSEGAGKYSFWLSAKNKPVQLDAGSCLDDDGLSVYKKLYRE